MRYRRKTSSCPSSFLRALCTRAHGSSRDDHEQPPDRRPHAGVLFGFRWLRTTCFERFVSDRKDSEPTSEARCLTRFGDHRAPSSDARYQARSGRGRHLPTHAFKHAPVKMLDVSSEARFRGRFGQDFGGFLRRAFSNALRSRLSARRFFRGTLSRALRSRLWRPFSTRVSNAPRSRLSATTTRHSSR